jgi:hypothetical protein
VCDAGLYYVEAQTLEMSRDELRRLELAVPQLWVLVELVTELDDVRGVGFHRLVDRLGLGQGRLWRHHDRKNEGEAQSARLHGGSSRVDPAQA